MYARSGYVETFYNKRMALEWPRRILTHRCTDINYEKHVFCCAQYVVLSYVTVHMLVHLIGHCLVLFDPDSLVRDYTLAY
jgi:hypothetical protein